MTLELQPATEADARRSAEIEGAAHASNAFNEILFPGPHPPDALDGRAKGLIAELNNDVTTRWSKVIDTDLPEDEDFGPGSNAEACELLFGGTKQQRLRFWRNKPHVYLSLLYTDPKHQGRGAGGMLVRHVVDEARKLGMIACLQSSPAGHELYKKCGFHDIDCLFTDLSKWGATETHRLWTMMCDPSQIP